jgi:hypothetical protein
MIPLSSYIFLLVTSRLLFMLCGCIVYIVVEIELKMLILVHPG